MLIFEELRLEGWMVESYRIGGWLEMLEINLKKTMCTKGTLKNKMCTNQCLMSQTYVF